MNLVVNGLRLTGRRYGVGRYLEYVLRGWQDIPHPFDRILVCVPGKPDGVALTLPASAELRIVGERHSGTYWEQVTLPAQRRNGDLLFCPSYVVPLASRGRTVLTHHGSYEAVPDAFPLVQRTRSRLIYQLSARKADTVITVSESSKADIVRFYGVSPAKIRVIPNGVDAAFHRLDDAEDARKTRLRYVNGDRPYVLFVGKVTRRRNIPNLIEAFAMLRRERRFEHALLIVGSDTPELNVRQMARVSGVQDDVFHCEYATHEELVHIYNAADVFIYPSSYEGFGMPVLEAMACGTPTITLSNTAFLEFAQGAAFFASDASIELLRRALEEVLSSKELQTTLSIAGLERSRAYGWEGVARQTMDVLTEVAAWP
jgi:glycosyltransferase involved in cell wall biosynthesis